MRTKLIVSLALFSILALAGCGSESASNGNQLSSLTISSGTLSPTFASSTVDYTVSVENSVTSVTVIPTAKDSGATIKVNDVAVTSGAASGSIDLAVGTTTITIIVTPKDGKKPNTYTIDMTRAAIGTGGIGAPCNCEDAGTSLDKLCSPASIPSPSQGNINGCDNVPANYNGLVKLCLRSSPPGTGTTAPQTYFANGYCSLGASNVSPCPQDISQDYICKMATFGTFDEDTNACPSGSVMITYSPNTAGTIMANYTLNTKVCAKSCIDDSNCRVSDGGYSCITKDGVRFCFDSNNLSGTYTAQ